MTNGHWTNSETMLTTWLVRTRHSQHSHHEAGKYYRTMHYIYGMPVVVLTTLIGTGAFASLEKQVSDRTKIWLGILSMAAAILTAIQTHFQFAERSEKHKSLGARYGNIRREIEELLALPPSERGEPRKVLDDIRAKLDNIGGEGPVVPMRIWKSTLKMLAEKDTKSSISSSIV